MGYGHGVGQVLDREGDGSRLLARKEQANRQGELSRRMRRPRRIWGSRLPGGGTHRTWLGFGDGFDCSSRMGVVFSCGGAQLVG